MQRIWEILPEINKTDRNSYKDFNQIVAQLLFNRGLKQQEDIKNFFSNDHEQQFHDPFLYVKMSEAADLIIEHIKKQNLIYIYGDYDADGVTASSLLFDVLSLLKAKVKVYLPDRVSEGYGMNEKAIDIIVSEGAKLIVTVDCGIRDHDNVKYAKQKGLEVIITDHHTPPPDVTRYPDCLIIDAQTQNESYPFKYLAGVGVSLKLASALISKSKLLSDDKNKVIDSLYDLVAVGTIADMVPLQGENRALIKKGLAVLNKTKRRGLLELKKVSGLDNKVLDAWNVGFQIGPRINAAGRMDHANTAFELLTTKNKEEAAALAMNLNGKNIERQQLTDEIFNQVDEQVTKQSKTEKILIGLCEIEAEDVADIWNEGVIGLVAGKICEKYYLPTLVITQTEEGYKGSGRSVPEIDLIEIIEKTKDLLDKYGGHPGACGFSLPKENFDKWQAELRELAVVKLKGKKLVPKIIIESELKFSDINQDLIKKIEEFAPFGKDNEKPKFVSYGVKIADKINMGLTGQHLKLKLTDGANIFSAIGFSQTEKWSHLRIGDAIDIVYYIEINEFNGRSEVQLKILDIKSKI